MRSLPEWTVSCQCWCPCLTKTVFYGYTRHYHWEELQEDALELFVLLCNFLWILTISEFKKIFLMKYCTGYTKAPVIPVCSWDPSYRGHAVDSFYIFVFCKMTLHYCFQMFLAFLLFFRSLKKEESSWVDNWGTITDNWALPFHKDCKFETWFPQNPVYLLNHSCETKTGTCVCPTQCKD